MKPRRVILPLAGAALLFAAGCITPFPTPSDLAHIKLDRADSPAVTVEKVWLERKNGPLVVRGLVRMGPEATDTTRTHLDLTLYDAAGQVLRSSVEHFEPRQIVRQWKRPADASYRAGLDPLPPGAVRIAVRAHEGSHSNP